MANLNSTPTAARVIVGTSRALELYEAGDLSAALKALDGFDPDPLPVRPEWSAAARDHVDLARNRIRKELGEPVQFAIMPVPLALRIAIGCVLGHGFHA